MASSLLFLSQHVPFPPHGGATIRTFNTLRQLAKSFNITALCFQRQKSEYEVQDVGSAIEALSEYAEVQVFPLPQTQSRVRYLWDHARSLISRSTYLRFVYSSRDFRRALDEVLREGSFDIVHADSLDLFRYFPQVAHLPLVCVHHDVQSVLLRRRAQQESHPVRRWYLRCQSEFTQQAEAVWCDRVDLNVTVSEPDRQKLGMIAPTAKSIVFPNGVDTEYFHPRDGGGGGVTFVGGTSWFPNVDALRFFSSDILPILREREPSLPVTWVGRATSEERHRFNNDFQIQMTGYVDDVRPYLWSADCFVVPLRVGGGTRVKILDAWASGKAIVSTSVGCEGLRAVDGENILIRDTPSGFADAVHTILCDRKLRQKLGRHGRRTVEREYSWDRIGSEMRSQYRTIIVR